MRIRIQTLDIACLAGLLALAIGGTVVSVKSVRSRGTELARRSQVVEACLGDLKTAQSVLGRLNATIRANQAALEQLRRRLPESKAMGEFLSELDAMMSRNGVDLNKVTPGVTVAEALCKRTPLTFSCRGAFADLHAVLYTLETQERIVRIQRVSIEQGDAPGDRRMDVSCSVYGR